jgi:exosome complex RNA-binding protein Rrp42 (RNase PH superfamily)
MAHYPSRLREKHLCSSVVQRINTFTISQVVDPALKEEAAMGGRMTITVNSHGEICAIQKGGGVGVTSDQVRGT